MKDKRTVTKEYLPEGYAIYRTCGADSVFLCCEDGYRDRAIDAFYVYSPVSGFLFASRSLEWHSPLISLKAKVLAENEEILEDILGGKYNSFAIRTNDIDDGLLLAYLLFRGRQLDYLVSASDGKGLAGCKGEKIVSDRRRGKILVDYFAEFEKEGSIIVAAKNFDSSLQALCSCSEISSIVVVSSLENMEPCVPVLSLVEAEGKILPHDNDAFKRMFLEAIDERGISVDGCVYAYLLNNIDCTDRFDTIREVAGCTRNLKRLEDECGTSILHNAITCSDNCHCSVIARGGGTHGNDLGDTVDIVRFLVSLGLCYKGDYPYDDIGGMSSEMYDSYKLGIMFRTLMECNCRATNDDLYEFMDNFICYAESNDSIVPIDDSHGPSYWQRLDNARCEQFDTMSPFIPDEVFSMRDADGSSLLISAAKHLENLPKLFKRILARSREVDAIDEKGCSALHYIRDLERWDALVASGAAVDIKDKEGRLPRLYFDRTQLLKLLSKSEYSDEDCEYAERMLFQVIDDSYSTEATYENKDIIISLLDIARPEARSWNDGTFLMEMIVQEGYFPEIYDRMLASGVDINAVDERGNNTLRLAVLSPECTLAKIRYLIERGADESANVYMGTVATIAAGLFHIKSPEWNALWELPDRNIFTYHNEDVMSPIMVAVHYLNMDAIRFLFSHDAVPFDEIDAIAERIGKIRSKTTKAEVLEYFFDFRKRKGL